KSEALGGIALLVGESARLYQHQLWCMVETDVPEAEQLLERIRIRRSRCDRKPPATASPAARTAFWNCSSARHSGPFLFPWSVSGLTLGRSRHPPAYGCDSSGLCHR